MIESPPAPPCLPVAAIPLAAHRAQLPAAVAHLADRLAAFPAGTMFTVVVDTSYHCPVRQAVATRRVNHRQLSAADAIQLVQRHGGKVVLIQAESVAARVWSRAIEHWGTND